MNGLSIVLNMKGKYADAEIILLESIKIINEINLHKSDPTYFLAF